MVLYVVLWMKHSGIEVHESHESHASTEAAAAADLYNKTIERAGLQNIPSFGVVSAKDLEEGQKFSCSTGSTTIHAFKVEATAST